MTRKVIVSMNVTLDGYMSGPNCELDWHFRSWGADMGARLARELGKADTILLGRVTYQAMARYWPAKVLDLLASRADMEFALMMNNHHKVVYSNTLAEAAGWDNSKLIHGRIEHAITRLKRSTQRGRDIIIYGSGKLVAALMKLGYVDEYHLWVHPVVLGKGKPLFRGLEEEVKLELLETKSFDSGVVLLRYSVGINQNQLP
jgi:dihydrofolate reductase